jgi:hypothetical protein
LDEPEVDEPEVDEPEVELPELEDEVELDELEVWELSSPHSLLSLIRLICCSNFLILSFCS